jgi:hypothetical protein
VNCSQPNLPQTSTSGTLTHTHTHTHTHTQIIYSHIPNKQLDDANKQRNSNSTKHGKRPPEDGQARLTETCRGFNDVIYKLFFNILVF